MRIYHFLDFWARERPDSEFAIQESQILTYAEASDLARSPESRMLR